MNSYKEEKEIFSFVYSYELDFNLRIKINSLESLKSYHSPEEVLTDPYLRYQGLYQNEFAELFATIQIFSGNNPLCMPITTCYHPFTNNWKWNERVELPLKYSAIPLDATIAITLFELNKPGHVKAVGGTTVSVFTTNGTLRKGKHRLAIWEGKEADGSWETTTPGKGGKQDRMFVFDKLFKKYERNEINNSIQWLDNLAFREIEKINQEEKKTRSTTLYVEFQKFDLPVVFGEKITSRPIHPASLQRIYDPESNFENLVEIKHRLLTRSYRRGPLGKDLKPNYSIRNALNEMIKYPPTKMLTTKEKDTIWKYRYYLTREKKALTFFLKCVEWEDAGESKQASELLEKWDPIDVDDALELLSSAFTNHEVRAYAVRTLEKAGDEDLVLFLLQLVQALKYEEFSEIDGKNGLSGFLIQRSLANRILANHFYWYICVECEDVSTEKSQKNQKTYIRVKEAFINAFDLDPKYEEISTDLIQQDELIREMSKMATDLNSGKDNRIKKIEKLKAVLGSPNNGLGQFKPLSLPLSPEITVHGIESESANIFKSAMQPLCLTFKTNDLPEGKYKTIFKIGDDLRQDQLILQLIKLMDQLLRKEQLDLKITPYKVLATGIDTGIVQFVESSLPVAAVLQNFGGILPFFKASHYDNSEPYGVSPDVMDTYVKSCAGYCVITYILGIGDRHLDNLMLTSTGNLFHIDFGFILGRDPKPFAPPMKITKEMVEGMGGAGSPDYKRFIAHCYSAFLILRRSANLILNLFSLMTDASLPDILLEPDKVVAKVQDKFRLDLSEEEAIQYLQSLINDSVSAFVPVIFDISRKYLQYVRK